MGFLPSWEGETVKIMLKPRVLIIVDTLDIVSLDFRQTLDNAGYATELILDSQAALDQIVYIKPDVIFLHLDLPAVSGTLLYQSLQNDERIKDIPVVALAAYKEVANRLFSFADIVLMRPVNHERLANLLSLLCSIDKPMDQTPWDALTGFYTPSFFIARLNQAIKKSHQNEKGDYIVFAINLDQLMKYEKKFGKEYRQQILQGAANVLKKVLRPADIVSRFESDQFLVLIDAAVDRYAPVSIAERMQFEFDEFLINSGLKNRLNIEIGVLYCTDEYKTTSEVLHDAQLAVEMARKNSRSDHRILQRTQASHANYFVGNKSLFSA
jgi:diguanylate cyclase (GGDEF)-like protein